MSRLTPEREVDIRLRVEQATFVNVYDAELLLSEIDALRRERDEAIVGAYRAAAAQVRSFNNAALCDLANEIEALPPQSALDAVERREREIAETALQEMNEWLSYFANTEGLIGTDAELQMACEEPTKPQQYVGLANYLIQQGWVTDLGLTAGLVAEDIEKWFLNESRDEKL